MCYRGVHVEMAPRLCKFECGTMLEGFDENARKYIEASSGGLHTKERCQEAKAKLEQKNDHGNENFPPVTSQNYINDHMPKQDKFVDHTLKPELKLKILTDPTPEGLAQKYNSFEKTIKFSQYQLAPSLYTIAIYYEEKP